MKNSDRYKFRIFLKTKLISVSIFEFYTERYIVVYTEKNFWKDGQTKILKILEKFIILIFIGGILGLCAFYVPITEDNKYRLKGAFACQIIFCFLFSIPVKLHLHTDRSDRGMRRDKLWLTIEFEFFFQLGIIFQLQFPNLKTSLFRFS